MIQFILEVPMGGRSLNLEGFFKIKPQFSVHFDSTDFELISWGDPIISSDFTQRFKMYGSVDFILKNIYGHYYFLLLEKRNGRIFMGNSFFSILPVYYCQIKDKIVISESALRLGRQTGKQKISKRYVLESLLFNYPLFNSTIFEEIQLLPVNTNLMISGDKVYLQKHTKIEDYFIRKPFSRKRSIRIITDKFIETVNKYFPSEHFMCTLTGGFDGRTITSAGKYLNKPFSTYSFGEESSKDIQIAQEVAQVAGIRYFKIPLDYSYIEKHSINNGREFIINSSGLATFTRAHYLYATKILSEKTKYILTGNFGSEIFRAVHIPGVFISANLYNLFATEKPDEGIKKIETSSEFRYLPLQIFREDWEALKCDLVNLPCYKNQLPGFSRNEKFYVFVFEEVFRKYFGAELVNQFYYLKNRTPFLDIDFLSAILSTRYAGVYSRYFEHNPLNRYKGQVLYASIINNTFPLLGDIKTDKGYKPNDLMSLFGKAAITKGYISRQISKNKVDQDPFVVNKAWALNKAIWLKSAEIEPMSLRITNPDILKKDLTYKILSLSFLINHINK